jgi:dTDP-4-amino-4,6-dideoxygalactose transaminase
MGDGGMMTSTDPATADRLRLLAGHGMRPRYYHQLVGINSRLDTFQAAVLRIKLRHLPQAVESRSTIAARYGRLFDDAGLVGDDKIVLPVQDPNAFHVWNQYAIRVTGGRRDALRAHLSENGVGSEIYYPIPMHLQECFADLEVDRETLIETERASCEVLNLPVFPSLTEAEQQRVVDTIAEYYAAGAKAAA